MMHSGMMQGGMGMGMGMGMHMGGMDGMGMGMGMGGHFAPHGHPMHEGPLGQGSAATNAADASRNLLVNYLPPSFDETNVHDVFSQAGGVERVKVIKDMHTQASKCFGFVTMSTPDAALRAIKDLSGKDVMGKKLRVAYAQPHLLPGGVSPSSNVFFSGFGAALGEAQLRDLAQRHGEVKECRILDPSVHPRGVGFVHFNTVPQAESCVNTLNNHQVPTSNGDVVTLAVKFAERKKDKEAQVSRTRVNRTGSTGGGFASNIVFVHGVGATSERAILDFIYPTFGSSGTIAKVDVPKGPNGEPRNFCFVHFADVRDAHRAMTLNGQVFNGKALQVKFK